MSCASRSELFAGSMLVRSLPSSSLWMYCFLMVTRKRFASIPYPVCFPTLALSTDNAAMIAAAGYPRLLRGERSDFSVKAQPSLAL